MNRFKTNQLNLNILLTYCANLTDWLTTSYWQTGWLNTSDWLELQLHYNYIVIEIIKDRKKWTTWLTIITTESDWMKHLSEWLNLNDCLDWLHHQDWDHWPHLTDWLTTSEWITAFDCLTTSDWLTDWLYQTLIYLTSNK